MLADVNTLEFPEHLSAAPTYACLWGDFLSPSTVDIWLSHIVIGLPLSSVMHLQEGFVACLVKRVTIQPENGHLAADSPTHTLYISAHGPPTPDGAQFLRQSPFAIVDHYVGHQDDDNAPDWVRRARSSLFFQYRAAPFANLFTRLASWKVNSDQVDLPLIMVAWARSMQNDYLTTPPNQRVATNTRHHKSDSWFAGICIQQSPTTVRNNDDWDQRPSQGELYAEEEAIVPKILDFGSTPFDYSPHAQPLLNFDDFFS